MWRCGDLKMRRFGDVEMWKCGDVEMWKLKMQVRKKWYTAPGTWHLEHRTYPNPNP
jgi:hypothetical protein